MNIVLTSHFILKRYYHTDWIYHNSINIACMWTYRNTEADHFNQYLTVVCIRISRHYAASRWLYLQTSLSICTNCEVELQVLRRACVWGSGVPIPLTDIKKEEAGTKRGWDKFVFFFLGKHTSVGIVSHYWLYRSFLLFKEMMTFYKHVFT